MKNFARLSLLLVSALALTMGASATTINLWSSPQTTNYVGAVLTGDQMPTASFDISQVSSGTGTAAVAITNPGGWASAIPGSQWISNNAISGPVTPDYVAPYGYYTYTQNFTVTGDTKIGIGSLSVMADDTAAVLLNGTLLEGYKPLGDDSHCATGGPGISCGGVYTINLSGMNLVDGVNTLTIVDLQAGQQSQGNAAGIDYSGYITLAPEPGTWALFGSGLLGLLFLAWRKEKSSAVPAA